MRCRILICFQLSYFDMLFLYPILGGFFSFFLSAISKSWVTCCGCHQLSVLLSITVKSKDVPGMETMYLLFFLNNFYSSFNATFLFLFFVNVFTINMFYSNFYTVYGTVIMITTLSINMFYSNFYTVYRTVIMITALSVNRNKHMSKPQT